MFSRLLVFLLCCPIIGACALLPSADLEDDAQVFDGLKPYAPPSSGESSGGLTPQVDSETGRGDYMLLYKVTDNGQAITTRFVGPSEAVGAPLRTRTDHEGDWSNLVAYVPRSDYQVTLAKWQLDAGGQIVNAHIRTQPFIEWRSLGIKPGQLVTNVEWRPFVDGHGVGDWRQ